MAEANKIARLNHQNIVRIYQCSQLGNGWIYSIMEYINGINLDAFIRAKHPDFFQRFRLWKQIEEALNYSHDMGVFHGDIHPGNILIVDETIKVIDFGTSIFAAKRANSQMRETRLLISLNRKLFLRYKPRLNEIVDVDLRILNPVLVLHALSAWVDILFKWQEIFSVTRREDWLMTAMHYLAFDVMGVPLFSIPRLVQQLARKKVSINVQNQFIASCLLWADIFLTKPITRGPYNLPYWPHCASLDPEVNEARLKGLTFPLRESFYKKGPLYSKSD